MKKVLRECVSVVAFLLILVFLIGQLTELFRNKGEWPLPQDFYHYPANSFDVIFVGPSTVMTSVYPMQLYQDYGIVSYNLSSAEQSIGETYYLAKDAIERQHPKVLMVDAGTISYLTSKVRSETIHHVTDNMPFFSKAKWEMILNLDTASFLQYAFPLDLYHTKWKSLSENDVKPLTRTSTLGARLTSIRSTNKTTTSQNEIDESTTLPKWTLLYVDKLIDLCKKTNTKLVFVSVPSVSMEQGLRNTRTNAADALSRYLKPYGITYLNYLDRASHFGIGTSDTWDGHHLNYWGATKFTAFIGKYLTETCGVSDRRGDTDYSFMSRKLAAYEPYRWQRLLATANDTKTYIDLLRDAAKKEGYIVSLAMNGTIGQSVDASHAAWFQELGTTTSLNNYGGDSYLAVLDGNHLITETDVRSRAEEDTFKEKVSGCQIEVTSSSSADNPEAEIRINGRSYALNQSGLNIVVYDPQNKKLIDSSVISISDGSYSLTHQ